VTDTGEVIVFALEWRDLLELARSRITRSMTKDECRKFLHTDGCL
jgi:hypothetical protein